MIGAYRRAMPSRIGRPRSARTLGAIPAVELSTLQHGIAGTVTTPEMPMYEARRASAVDGLPALRPAAIVACATASDVALTIALADRWGVRVAPRSGGHCYAGRSTTAGIVLDVAPMDAVAVTGDLAVVGAGVRLDALYDALHAHDRTVPAGCGPTVGIAGLTLGGGLGILGRRHGLTCDSLVAAQVVLADGTTVDCDAEHEPELFWGLRGAGGGQFGVVTALTLRTIAAPSATAFDLRWPAAAAAAAVDAWQRWAPDAPDAVNATLRVVAPADPDHPLHVQLIGAVLGPASGAVAQLGEFADAMPSDPSAATFREAPYRAAKRWLLDRDAGEEQPAPSPARAGKSGFFRRLLPTGAIDRLLAHAAAGRAPGHVRELALTPWGGAYNRVPAHATAFAHRDERFLLEHVALAPSGEAAAAHAWARRSHATTRAWSSGRVYPNFPDPELADWPAAYHGRNHDRLRRVKRRYDPGRVFGFHQSL